MDVLVCPYSLSTLSCKDPSLATKSRALQQNYEELTVRADISKISNLHSTRSRHLEVFPQVKLADPAVAGNSSEYQRVAKAAAELQETVETYRQIFENEQELVEAKSLLKESAGQWHS